MLKAILFDLDETLYPRASTLMPTIGARIRQYVVERMGVTEAEADALRIHWRQTYGTALRGMVEEGYDVDLDDFLQFVHDIPLEGIIEAQPEVREMLLSIPLRRAVLTNSDAAHATRVLQHVNLLDCFERIIDIRALKFINKPDPKAYAAALAIMGVRADEAILVEDTPVNTKPAKMLGMKTILVDYPITGDSDFYVATLLGVKDVVKHLLASEVPS
jgi:putative hydrolase of the HAD superfamily